MQDFGTNAASTKSTARWVLAGVLIVGVFGFLGHRATRPDSIGAGVLVGSLTAGWVLAAAWRWHREASSRAPTAEYLAAVWAIAYVTLLVVTSIDRDINMVDALILMPPVSALPLALRTLLRDDGDPGGLARTVASRLHQVLGVALACLGLLYVVSLILLYVAPFVLVPAAMHLRSAHEYRLDRSTEHVDGHRSPRPTPAGNGDPSVPA